MRVLFGEGCVNARNQDYVVYAKTLLADKVLFTPYVFTPYVFTPYVFTPYVGTLALEVPGAKVPAMVDGDTGTETWSALSSLGLSTRGRALYFNKMPAHSHLMYSHLMYSQARAVLQ